MEKVNQHQNQLKEKKGERKENERNYPYVYFCKKERKRRKFKRS